MLETTTLRLIRHRLKMRRRIRSVVQWISHKVYPISDAFDRAPLTRAALPKAIATAPAHAKADGEIAVYSTYCGMTRSFTFDRNNRVDRYPHYFISNNPRVLQIVEAMGWRPVFLDLPISSNPVLSAQQAKVAKCLPHLFPDLARYRHVVYSDDKRRINQAEIEEIIPILAEKEGAIAMRLSPHISDNMLWEFTDSLMQERYRTQAHRMLRFIIKNTEAGKTLEADRLFTTNFSVRDQADPACAGLSERWYDDVLDCGIDCQLAFDFLAQGEPKIIDLPAPKRKKYLGKKL